MNIASLSNLDISEDGDFGDGQFFCAEGIVERIDDPEKRCRVQCVVPLINETEVYPVWARRVQLFVGDPGYADFHVPARGVEVMLIGRLGDTNNLFYAPLANEINGVPSEFESVAETGVKVPDNHKIISDKKILIDAQNLEAIAEQVAKILAQNVEIAAQQLAKVSGQTVEAAASQTAKVSGNQIQLDGSQIKLDGTQINLDGNGNISINGGNISIKGASVSIEGRPVRKIGPAI